MAYTKEQIEYLHDSGKMPDWAYYQQNGATAQENYNRQIQAFRNRLRDKQKEEQQQKELEKRIEKKLEKKLEKTLEDLLRNLNFNIVLK